MRQCPDLRQFASVPDGVCVTVDAFERQIQERKEIKDALYGVRKAAACKDQVEKKARLEAACTR